MLGRLLFLAVVPVSLTLAADAGGIRPRGAPSDYPAHQASKGVTVAAAVIPPEQVSKLFASNLNKAGYLVVEVAVFPDTGNEVDVRTRDFLMRAGSEQETLRPVGPETIAARQQRKNAPKTPTTLPGDISIYPTSTIGWESGGYDPVTGRRRGGVYTGGGVGVGVGQPPVASPPPGATDTDGDTMAQELGAKELPQMKTVEPVAGYLYFPKPTSSKAMKGPFHITYYTEHERIQLEIPAFKK